MNDEDQAPQDQEVENHFVMETAKKVILDERASPGSQDPELVRWATDKLSGDVSRTVPPVPVPAPPTASPPPPQPEPAPNELRVPHERAAYDNPTNPTAGTTQDNGTMIGENNGNSN